MSDFNASDHLVQHVLAEIRRLREAGTPANDADIMMAGAYLIAGAIARHAAMSDRERLIAAAGQQIASATDLLVSVRRSLGAVPT